MKIWKIVLLIIVGLIILFIGFVIYNSYQYSKFYDEAENLGSVRFGSEMFNQKLKDCSISYGGSTFLDSYWEIRGLENNRCMVVYREPEIDEDCYNNPENCGNQIEVSYKTYVCELPYKIYSNLENINWEKILNEEYCKSQNNEKEITIQEQDNNNEIILNQDENLNPTKWDLLDLPLFSSQVSGNTKWEYYQTNIKCTEDMIVVDRYLTYQFSHSCPNGGSEVSMFLPPSYLAQLDREGLTPLRLVASYNFNKYGSEYDWEEFEI